MTNSAVPPIASAATVDLTVRGFTLYRIVSRFSFYIPIFIVALLDAKLSFLAIGLVLFVYGLATTFFGGMATRVMAARGPGATIARGEAFKAAANAIVALVVSGLVVAAPSIEGLALLAFAQAIGGIGYSLAAVADGSFLSLAGPVLAMDKDLQRTAQARSSSAMFLSFLVAGVLGAIAYPLAAALPFLATSAANLSAAAIAALLLAPAIGRRSPAAADGAAAGEKAPRKPGVGPAMTMVIANYAFLRSVVLVVQILILPVWFFVHLRIEIVWFGLLFGLYTLCGFVGGRFYPRFCAIVGERASPTVIVLVCAATLLLVAVTPNQLAVLLVPAGFFFVAGMLRPAFLPALSGGVRNLVPVAERVFGVMSSAIYLVVAAAFFRDVAPTTIMFAAACLVLIYLGLSMLFTTAYSGGE